MLHGWAGALSNAGARARTFKRIYFQDMLPDSPYPPSLAHKIRNEQFI